MYKTIENITDVLKRSHERTVLILKHSRICPISARGKREVDKFLESCDRDLEAYLVVVQRERPISNELARVLGVLHQSPQVLVVRDGTAEKVLNHYEITGENIEKAVVEK